MQIYFECGGLFPNYFSKYISKTMNVMDWLLVIRVKYKSQLS